MLCEIKHILAVFNCAQYKWRFIVSMIIYIEKRRPWSIYTYIGCFWPLVFMRLAIIVIASVRCHFIWQLVVEIIFLVKVH